MAVARARVRKRENHFLLSGKQIFPGGQAESIGKRTTMEDACAIVGEFAGPETQFYGVFDGHGGINVALYCATEFPGLLSKHYEITHNMIESLQTAIQELNTVACEKWPVTGSTLAVAIIADGKLFTANVGDTRIIMVKNGVAERLSYDHKISDPEERSAIIERGGLILHDRVGGTLALSRAIGDGSLAANISAVPYITENQYDSDTRLILACDGVWDVMSDDDAAKIFTESGDPSSAAKAIKEEALTRGTQDNVTVVCVQLKPKE